VETDAERERLRALVARLSDKDLSHPMTGGWTVAAVLAIKALSDEMLGKIEATGGPPFNLSRAIHRKEHLDEIEALFGSNR
jgi:hypothetical protein